MSRSTINIALVGMTGVGKSTLVNVLLGEERAGVSNDVRPCTTKTLPYEVVDGRTRYCIWDTRGLNEATEQAALATRILRLARFVPDADRESKKLLRGSDPKIDLALLCIDAKKIRVREHWKIYNKIYSDFCGKKLRVAVVVTQMGERDLGSSAWKRTCEIAAEGVVEEFPDARLIEAVPYLEENDTRVQGCRNSILELISNACQSQP